MAFADHYLARYAISHHPVNIPVPADLQRVVVIPCYNEPRVTETLEDLWSCERAIGSGWILVVVNSPENSPPAITRQNEASLKDLRTFERLHRRPDMELRVLYRPDIPGQHTGAGLARKIGMDWAVSAFNETDRPGGLIISLDADCRVDRNYFRAIHDYFSTHPGIQGANLHFEHPLDEPGMEGRLSDAMIQYELYLRYYVRALRHTGHPFIHHALGSAFTVRAGAYAKVGGMNRRKAGEDFYFLQKLIPVVEFGRITGTTVYPAARPSPRVVFGTGPSLERLMHSGKDWMSYQPEALDPLKDFFAGIEGMFRTDPAEMTGMIRDLHPLLREFLDSKDFDNRIREIRNNAASPESFRKRFFRWFGMLKILQYLNYTHKNHFKKIPVREAAYILLKENYPEYHHEVLDARSLLLRYREMDKTSPA